jgi:hypothetical protein
MANVFAIHSVGNSVASFLRNTYPAQIGPVNMPDCNFELVSSGQLAGDQDETTRITLYLHRITLNEHSQRSAGKSDKTLSLDLHYLLTAWAATPLEEQITMAWAMRQLHLHPLLDVSSLSPEAGWHRGDSVQIIPSELTTEDVMRIWDALTPAYRLSTSYVARVVHLEPDIDSREFAPVVARRLAVGEAVLP